MLQIENNCGRGQHSKANSQGNRSPREWGNSGRALAKPDIGIRLLVRVGDLGLQLFTHAAALRSATVRQTVLGYTVCSRTSVYAVLLPPLSSCFRFLFGSDPGCRAARCRANSS